MEFLEQFVDDFGEDKMLSKVVMQMGGVSKGSKRIEVVKKRFNEISSNLFTEKGCWIGLILWDYQRKVNTTSFRSIKFDVNSADKIFLADPNDKKMFKNRTEEDRVFYLYYKNYSFLKVKPLIESIAKYELGMEPSTNLNAYFICLESEKFMINLYDDRGMEILSPQKSFIDKVKDSFPDYVLS